MIDKIAKALEDHGHDRFAYQEEVWRRAQEAMEDETIWCAVKILARELEDYWPWEVEDDEAIGVFAGTMAGSTARAGRDHRYEQV